MVGSPVRKESIGGRAGALALEPVPIEITPEIEARRRQELHTLGDVVNVLRKDAGLPLRAAGVAPNHGGGNDRRRKKVLIRSAHDLAQVCSEQQAMHPEGSEPAGRPGEAEALILGRHPLPRR